MSTRARIFNVTAAALVSCGLLVGCGGGGGGGGPVPAADLIAPLFMGVDGGSTAGGPFVRLDWQAAVDDSGAAPSYRIYASATSGGQSFGAPPAATSAAGTTSTILSAGIGTTNYYTVRSVDGSGNEDGNTVEVGVTPVAPANVAFVSDTGGAGTLGDPSDPFATIQAGVTAVEGAGGGLVLVDAALGGTTYAEEVDLTAAVSMIGLYGGYPRFSALPAAPTGSQILGTRDLAGNPTRIAAPGLPYIQGDLVRVANGGSPTCIDGFSLRGDPIATALTGMLTFNDFSTSVGGVGTLFTTEVQVGDILQFDGDGAAFSGTVASISNDTSLELESEYRGDGGTGAASVLTVGGPVVRAIDADLQVSRCRLPEGGHVESGTTVPTTGSTLRFVGNRADDFGFETCVVGGGCDLLRFENNTVLGRRHALTAIESAAALRVLASGTTVHLSNNLIDGMSRGEAPIEMDFREASMAAGGRLDIFVEGNEIRNHNGQGVKLDGVQRVGMNGETHITVRNNLFNGGGDSGFEVRGFEGGVEDPSPGADTTIQITDNQFLNNERDLCDLDLGVSAGRQTTVLYRNNFVATSQSEALRIDDLAGPTDNTSDGGIVSISIVRNFNFGGSEDFYVDVGVPYGGRTHITATENTVLGAGEPGLELRCNGRIGTSTAMIPFPNGFASVNVFNNDLHGSDDEGVNFQDRRDSDVSGAQDDSVLTCYIGHNLARNGSDGSDGAIELQYRSDNGAFLLERNFTGGGGQDSSESGIELETSKSALRNYVRVQNNVATLGSGGGITWDPLGGFPQFVNNTAAYSSQSFGSKGFEMDSSAQDGDDQAFLLNCLAAYNGGGDIDRKDGTSPTYSLIRDETNVQGLGNISGEPFFDNDLDALDVFGVETGPLADLFSLLPSSPAVNAGHPDPRYNDPDGTRNDMGAYGGPGAGPIGIVGLGTPLPLRYVGTFPAVDLFTGAVLPSNTQALWFGFNTPVGPTIPAGQIQVSNGGAAVPGALSVEAGGYLVKFTPAGTLNPTSGTFVDVEFSAALTSLSGQMLGRTERHRFSVRPAAAAESEPNDDGAPGVLAADLAAAQSLGVAGASAAFEVAGAISSATDVDVYAFTASAGDRIQATVLDARNGGGNDGLIHLDLYDSNGLFVTVGRRDLFNEGILANGGDPFLDHVLAAGGTYYLVVWNPDTAAPPQSYVLQGVLD